MRKKRIKLTSFKEAFLAGMSEPMLTESDFVERLTYINNEGINETIEVYEKRQILRKFNVVFCGYITLTNGCKIIVVDDVLRSLPKHHQQALIYHEVGHAMDNTYNSLSIKEIKKVHNLRFLGNRKSMKYEENADRYAAKMTSKNDLLDAYKYIYNNFKVNRKDLRIKIKQVEAF